jgi:hypothetical protein
LFPIFTNHRVDHFGEETQKVFVVAIRKSQTLVRENPAVFPIKVVYSMLSDILFGVFESVVSRRQRCEIIKSIQKFNIV